MKLTLTYPPKYYHECPYCKGVYHYKGFPRHRRACEEKSDKYEKESWKKEKKARENKTI